MTNQTRPDRGATLRLAPQQAQVGRSGTPARTVAEERWFAGQPLIAVRHHPCTTRTMRREPGNLRGENCKRSRSGTGWRGADGRRLMWAFRVLMWVVLLAIGYRRRDGDRHQRDACRLGRYLSTSPAIASQRISERRVIGTSFTADIRSPPSA